MPIYSSSGELYNFKDNTNTERVKMITITLITDNCFKVIHPLTWAFFLSYMPKLACIEK